MGFFNLGGAVNSGGGAALPKLPGNGIVVHHDGQWTVVEIDAVGSVKVDNPGGLGGHPLVRVRPWLGQARDIDLATVGDKPIRIEPFLSAIREITVGLSTDTPAGCVASIWTGRNRTGDNLATFTAAELATMTSWKVMVQRLMNDRPRQADYIYLNVQTASTRAASISVFVDGTTWIEDEETGLVPA